MSDSPAISFRGSFSIAGTMLFRDLDITLPGGQWSCLLGSSGVGKSTILRLILGLPSDGVFDGEISAMDGAPLAPRVSYMAQSDLLLPWLSVRENTVLGARLRGKLPDWQRADDLLRRVGLADHKDKRPIALSGGMRQRNALARTLMEDRPIVLLDEPFSALDANTRADMQELAARLLKGRTVLIVTHDPAEASRLGHQILLMSPDGMRQWTPPSTPPIRAIDDPEALSCQTALLAHLRKVYA